MQLTNVFWKTLKALKNKKELIISYGGSRSSKTYSKIQILSLIAKNKPGTDIKLVASTIPKIKTTILKDFIEIMGDSFNHKSFNKQELLYKFDNGSEVKFMNADVPENFTGVKSDYVLLDEPNTYRHGKHIFQQLENRNNIAMIVCFNPASKFWINEHWDFDTTEVIHSTYKDNPYLEQKIINTLERRAKTDINFYKVYTLGEWGSLDGLIFKENVDWCKCDTMPTDYDYKFYGLDFGFNHPTSLTEVIIDNNNLYAREVFTKTELNIKDIVRLIKEQNINNYILGDVTSGVNMVDELKSYGIPIIKAKKGGDSVMFGIDKIKSFDNFYVLNTSTTLIKDLNNYSYMLDTEGNAMNVPDKKKYDPHCIDSVRYAISTFNI